MIIVILWLSRISIFMNKIILAFMKVVGWIIPALGKYIGYTNGLMGSGFFSKKKFSLSYVRCSFCYVLR